MNEIDTIKAELDALDLPNRRRAELEAALEAAENEQRLAPVRELLRQNQADYMKIRPGFEKARAEFEKAKKAFDLAKETWSKALAVEQDRYAAVKIARQLGREAGLSAEEVNNLCGGTGNGGNG